MRTLLSALLVLMLTLVGTQYCHGWGDGLTPTMDTPCSRCYGTHDFLAEHALTFLPYERSYSWLMAYESRPHGVLANAEYLFGTEVPDRGGYGFQEDHSLHSVYYTPDGSLQYDYAASRAQEYYEQTQRLLDAGDLDLAARYMGIVSHYVTDVASYWHVMGKDKEWVKAAQNGLAYENWVDRETNNYNAPFASCLSFDGRLDRVSAYDVTLKLAYDTTFDTSGSGRTAEWMDSNYNPGRAYYRERVCQSLSLAANAVADLIYSVSYPGVENTATSSVATTGASTSAPAVSTITMTTSLLNISTVTVTATKDPFQDVATVLVILAVVVAIVVVFSLSVRSRRESSGVPG